MEAAVSAGVVVSKHRRKRSRVKGTKSHRGKTWQSEPAWWRRMLNRLFRANVKQTMREGGDPSEKHPKKNGEGYYW